MEITVKVKRGFAAMSAEKQREIASKGGRSIPAEKRAFSKNRKLASDAGRKGGAAVADENRPFAVDRELASRAGRIGGLTAQGGGQ